MWYLVGHKSTEETRQFIHTVRAEAETPSSREVWGGTFLILDELDLMILIVHTYLPIFLSCFQTVPPSQIIFVWHCKVFLAFSKTYYSVFQKQRLKGLPWMFRYILTYQSQNHIWPPPSILAQPPKLSYWPSNNYIIGSLRTAQFSRPSFIPPFCAFRAVTNGVHLSGARRVPWMGHICTCHLGIIH